MQHVRRKTIRYSAATLLLTTLYLSNVWLSSVNAQPPANSQPIVSTGVVVPYRSVTLAAKVIGRVASVHCEEGSTVRDGKVLIRLDDAVLAAERASAEASLALATTELKHKTKLKDRMQRLVETMAISKDRVDDAEFEHAAAQGKVRIAQASLAKVKAELKEARIVAPFDGIVTKKSVEIGQLTQPGQPLIVLEDHTQLKFETKVKEQEVVHVQLGEPAIVTVDALQGLPSMVGTVHKIIPSGDPVTHDFSVEIVLPKQNGLLPGMFGKVRF